MTHQDAEGRELAEKWIRIGELVRAAARNLEEVLATADPEGEPCETEQMLAEMERYGTLRTAEKAVRDVRSGRSSENETTRGLDMAISILTRLGSEGRRINLRGPDCCGTPDESEAFSAEWPDPTDDEPEMEVHSTRDEHGRPTFRFRERAQPDEENALYANLPHPPDDGRTHYNGCWEDRGHHNCAVVEARTLRARLRDAESSVRQDDVRDLLEAVGLEHYARPVSPHRVVQDEVLPAIRGLRSEAERLRGLLEEAESRMPNTALGARIRDALGEEAG